MPEARSFRLFVVLAIVYGLGAFTLPDTTFWSNDGGEKLLQVKEMASRGVGLPVIPYDSLGVEAEGSFRFSPFPTRHAAPEGGRLVPIVPLYFPLLNVLPYRALGAAGLYLLPWASALLVLWFVYRVAERVFDSAVAFFCLAAAGLGSSVVFYGLTFWEHTLAAAACAASLFLLCSPEGRLREGRGVLAMAGFALASAAWVRGEALIVVAAFSGAMLLLGDARRALPWFVAGVLAGLAPQWLCNSWIYGNALGPQVASAEVLQQDSLVDSLAAMAAKRWDVTRGLFFDYGFGAVLGIALAFASFAIPAALARGKVAAFCTTARVWLALSIAVVVASLLLFFTQSDLILATMTHTPIWVALPVLPLMFLRGSRTDGERRGFAELLYVAALLGLAGLALGLPSRGGLQWGPRYALVLFPVLVVCAGAGYQRLGRRAPGLRAWCWGLVVVGAMVQITGAALLFHKKSASAESLAAIRSLEPDVVMTDVWWLAEDGADLYHDVPMYGFADGQEFVDLTERLGELGHTRVVLASRGDFRGLFDPVAAIDMEASRQLRPARLASFDLNLHLLRLRTGE